jgi:hypothetical protein
MKHLVTITVLLLFFMSSCAPSLRQLENYETVQSLEQGYLLVTLENHSEEILLLKKYGQHKKAERIARKDAKYNSNIKQAITKNYDYSKVAYTYANKHSDSVTFETLKGEPVNISNKTDTYLMTFYTRVSYNENNEEELMALKITPKFNSFLESSTIYVEGKVNNNLNGYNHLLKKMNQKLYRLHQAAEDNLVYQDSQTTR